MKKEFVNYEEALALKELGFDEPCWAWWHIEDCDTRFCYSEQRSPIINSRETEVVGLPTYSQVFRWFREKYNRLHTVNIDLSNNLKDKVFVYTIEDHLGSIIDRSEEYTTYEEAELACLIKLIEIVKDEKCI